MNPARRAITQKHKISLYNMTCLLSVKVINRVKYQKDSLLNTGASVKLSSDIFLYAGIKGSVKQRLPRGRQPRAT